MESEVADRFAHTDEHSRRLATTRFAEALGLSIMGLGTDAHYSILYVQGWRFHFYSN
ncbi:MAG TPA: hypothetical protein VMR62_29785 [Bryobacteraceae bacterium]|nr:hypothetical protein [Bryobacteraceae bacterium]